MTEPTSQTSSTAPTSSSTIQVRLTTRTETPISSTPIVIPTNVTRYSLSQILNHLLENPTPIPYSFLINSVYLPTTLDEYIASNGVSREEILEIEYVRSVLPPQWEGQWTQEDWVAGVSVRETGVVSGGYDGIVRVWDWSGNILAKGRSGDGALRPVKCVKWIDGGFVSGGMDGSVRVYGYQDGVMSLLLEGKGHEASVDSVDCRAGKAITASADGCLRLWSVDPSEGEMAKDSSSRRKKRRTDTSHPIKSSLATFTPTHGSPLTSTIFHPSDSSIAYSTSLSTHLHTHDLMTASSQPISSTPFTAPLLSLASLSSISLLALGTSTNKILLHDPRAHSITITALSGHEGFVTSLSPSPENQNMFASGSFDGYIRVWDVRNPSGSVFKLDRQVNSGRIFSIDWNESGLVSGGQDGKIDIWRGGNSNTMAKL